MMDSRAIWEMIKSCPEEEYFPQVFSLRRALSGDLQPGLYFTYEDRYTALRLCNYLTRRDLPDWMRKSNTYNLVYRHLPLCGDSPRTPWSWLVPKRLYTRNVDDLVVPVLNIKRLAVFVETVADQRVRDTLSKSWWQNDDFAADVLKLYGRVRANSDGFWIEVDHMTEQKLTDWTMMKLRWS